jgi:hypothetical protein
LERLRLEDGGLGRVGIELYGFFVLV